MKLYALPWAFPGWVTNGTSDGSPYGAPEVTAGYVTKFVEGAKSEYGLHIDYVGSWNERAYNKTYLLALRSALDAAGFGSTQIVAADRGWQIATDMRSDAQLDNTVDVVGVHYPGTKSTPDAVALDKPLWASEDMSTYNDLRGAGCWAKILNRNYVIGNMTATISWNMVASYFTGLLWQGTGILEATEPWSGHWNSDNMGLVYGAAHTTHFAQPGWHYLRHGSGAGNLTSGGSYVTLTNGSDWSLVVEKMAWAHSQCIRPAVDEYDTAPETATFKLSADTMKLARIAAKGSKSAGGGTTLAVWRTQFGWDGMVQTNSTYMERGEDIAVAPDGTFSVEVAVDALITITTCRGCGHKAEPPPSKPSQPFPTSYADDFDSYPLESEAAYFTDQAGSWQIVQADDEAHGRVMRQSVPLHPVSWSGDFSPYSIIGDISWRKMSVVADILIEPVASGPSGAAFIGAWSRTCCQPSGVYFAVWPDNGTWAVSNTLDVFTSTILSGDLPTGIKPGVWFTLMLEVTADGRATGFIGTTVLFSAADLGFVSSGWAAIGTTPLAPNSSQWTLAQFDNFDVSGTRLQCGAAAAGTPVTISWCSGEVAASDVQWVAEAGSSTTIALKSQAGDASGLCWSASGGSVVLADCGDDSKPNKFTFSNSTQYPWTQLHVGTDVVTTKAVNPGQDSEDPESILTYSPATLGVAECRDAEHAPLQRLTVSDGRLASAHGTCLSSESMLLEACPEGAASGDGAFAWRYEDGALVSGATGMCLSLSGDGKSVSMGVCNGAASQRWAARGGAVAQGGVCLTASGGDSGTRFVWDEAGTGQFTVFGPHVTDHCVAACP